MCVILDLGNERGDKLNPLDYIEDTKQAGKLWGMTEHNVKRLIYNGEIRAKKIGNSWAIDMTQANPKKYKLDDKGR